MGDKVETETGRGKYEYFEGLGLRLISSTRRRGDAGALAWALVCRLAMSGTQGTKRGTRGGGIGASGVPAIIYA